MNNPYKVLGVDPSVSDDELKQAYRELAKKYHPDNYVGSPLADLAGEKMSEINAAYDAVQEERRSGGPSRGPIGSSPQGGYQSAGGPFGDIRRMVETGRMFEAEELLDGVPAAARTAEWHFLKGTVLYSRGFLERALQHFQTAVGLAPQNDEYRNTFETIMRQRQYGYSTGPVMASSGCSPCGLCSALICADCTCSTCRCCCCGS